MKKFSRISNGLPLEIAAYRLSLLGRLKSGNDAGSISNKRFGQALHELRAKKQNVTTPNGLSPSSASSFACAVRPEVLEKMRGKGKLKAATTPESPPKPPAFASVATNAYDDVLETVVAASKIPEPFCRPLAAAIEVQKEGIPLKDVHTSSLLNSVNHNIAFFQRRSTNEVNHHEPFLCDPQRDRLRVELEVHQAELFWLLVKEDKKNRGTEIGPLTLRARLMTCAIIHDSEGCREILQLLRQSDGIGTSLVHDPSAPGLQVSDVLLALSSCIATHQSSEKKIETYEKATRIHDEFLVSAFSPEHELLIEGELHRLQRMKLAAIQHLANALTTFSGWMPLYERWVDLLSAKGKGAKEAKALFTQATATAVALLCALSRFSDCLSTQVRHDACVELFRALADAFPGEDVNSHRELLEAVLLVVAADGLWQCAGETMRTIQKNADYRNSLSGTAATAMLTSFHQSSSDNAIKAFLSLVPAGYRPCASAVNSLMLLLATSRSLPSPSARDDPSDHTNDTNVDDWVNLCAAVLHKFRIPWDSETYGIVLWNSLLSSFDSIPSDPAPAATLSGATESEENQVIQNFITGVSEVLQEYLFAPFVSSGKFLPIALQKIILTLVSSSDVFSTKDDALILRVLLKKGNSHTNNDRGHRTKLLEILVEQISTFADRYVQQLKSQQVMQALKTFGSVPHDHLGMLDQYWGQGTSKFLHTGDAPTKSADDLFKFIKLADIFDSPPAQVGGAGKPRTTQSFVCISAIPSYAEVVEAILGPSSSMHRTRADEISAVNQLFDRLSDLIQPPIGSEHHRCILSFDVVRLLQALDSCPFIRLRRLVLENNREDSEVKLLSLADSEALLWLYYSGEKRRFQTAEETSVFLSEEQKAILSSTELLDLRNIFFNGKNQQHQSEFNSNLKENGNVAENGKVGDLALQHSFPRLPIHIPSPLEIFLEHKLPMIVSRDGEMMGKFGSGGE